MKSKNERILLALITFLLIYKEAGKVRANSWIRRRSALERKNTLDLNDKVTFFFPNELETKVNDYKINPANNTSFGTRSYRNTMDCC